MNRVAPSAAVVGDLSLLEEMPVERCGGGIEPDLANLSPPKAGRTGPIQPQPPD
jgi:hypothetical protein